jgi:hypothetical protein
MISDYYNLDDIGFIGVQEEKSPASKKYYDTRTARIFKAAMATRPAPKKILKKI